MLSLRVASAFGLSAASAGAMAAAETYASDAAAYITGDGKLTLVALITATAGFVVVGWVAKKLGLWR